MTKPISKLDQVWLWLGVVLRVLFWCLMLSLIVLAMFAVVAKPEVANQKGILAVLLLFFCVLLFACLMDFGCFASIKAFLKKHSTKIKTVFFLICSFVVGLALYIEKAGFSKWEGGWINEDNEMLIIKQDGNQISMYYWGINMEGGSFDDNSRVMTSYRFSGGSSDLIMRLDSTLIMRLDRTQNNSFDAWKRLGINSKDEKFAGTFHRR